MTVLHAFMNALYALIRVLHGFKKHLRSIMSEKKRDIEGVSCVYEREGRESEQHKSLHASMSERKKEGNWSGCIMCMRERERERERAQVTAFTNEYTN